MKYSAILASAFLGLSMGAFAQQYSTSVPAGTKIEVRTNDTIDVKNTSDGRIYSGVVNSNVMDPNGNVAIPKGSNAELIVRNLTSQNMSVDLESVSVNGNRYIVASNGVNRSTGKGIGKNKRTAEYVGGGAAIGSIIGAIAGGGKGAAIGAAIGGASGAGTQAITKGNSVRIPSESVLTFRLDQPLQVGQGAFAQDNGYTRDGYHYHNR
ncbi:MAG: hypothetical protein M3Z85_02855 [Acidobacteriota bacterium]|nr:hypothetical protein [Acidobacteriota bacterium]